MNTQKQCALNRVQQLYPQLAELCMKIHDNPELGFQETFASNLLTSFLEEEQFAVERNCAKLPTAFRAERSSGKGGPTIGFLCEYDALPEIGHGCGHNIIATAAVGAAAAAASVVNQLGGSVVVLGTPSEEGAGGGKQLMWDAGSFQGVDCAMMFHPGSQTVVRDKTLAIQSMRFVYHGIAAHAGAAQEQGRNALEAAIQTFNGINSLRGHLSRDVNIHGIITKGGTAPNIIPDLAESLFAVRAKTAAALRAVVERVCDCARGAAMMTGCTVEIVPVGVPYLDILPNETLLAQVEKNLEELQIPIDVRQAPDALASTDVGNLSHHIPAIQCMIGVGSPALPHSQSFADACAGEAGAKIAIQAAMALTATAVDLMENPQLVQQAKLEQAQKEHNSQAEKEV